MANIILVALFPLIFLIALGYVLKRFRFLEDKFWHGAEKLNYYLLFPVMLFLGLAHAEIQASEIRHMMLGAGLTLLIAVCLLYILKALYGTAATRFGVYMQGMVRFNTYIGLALSASLFYQQGMALFAILLVFCIPLVNILSVLALTNSEGMRLQSILLSLLKNPLILGCIAGGVFNLLNLRLWIGFENYLKQIAISSLPLGLMCIGAALQFQGLRKDLRTLLLNTFGRLLLMPMIALATCLALNLPALHTQILVMFFALPTASSAYILTKVLGGDSQLMASVISLQTVCAAFSLPLILWWVM